MVSRRAWGKEAGAGRFFEGDGKGRETYSAGWDVLGYGHALRGVAGSELGGWDGRGAVCDWGALGCCLGEEGEAESDEDCSWLHDCSGRGGLDKWKVSRRMLSVFSEVMRMIFSDALFGRELVLLLYQLGRSSA